MPKRNIIAPDAALHRIAGGYEISQLDIDFEIWRSYIEATKNPPTPTSSSRHDDRQPARPDQAAPPLSRILPDQLPGLAVPCP